MARHSPRSDYGPSSRPLFEREPANPTVHEECPMKHDPARQVQFITDHCQLLYWLNGCILESEPQRPINGGLVKTATWILEEVRDTGHFSIDPAMWGEMIDSILDSVMDSTSSPVSAVGLIGFASAACGEMAEHEEVTIEDVNRLLIDILRYREMFLRIHRVGQRRYLESTPECVRRFGITVRVRLHQRGRWRRYVVKDKDVPPIKCSPMSGVMLSSERLSCDECRTSEHGETWPKFSRLAQPQPHVASYQEVSGPDNKLTAEKIHSNIYVC
jgi:hypothetical protein